MKRKLLIALPLIAGAVFLSEIAFTKLNSFTSTQRAGDPIGPGVTTKKDCSACHNTGTVTINDNVANRIFTFDTGQTKYLPGQTYTISYKVMGPANVGFSATVLKASDKTAAGTMAAIDSTQCKPLAHASGRQYMNHMNGSSTGGSKTYTFSWTAPAAGTGDVTFYFASISGDGNDDMDNDTMYLNSYTLTEGSSTGLNVNSAKVAVNVFPNPATDRIEVALSNAAAGETSVSLISLDGKSVVELMNTTIAAGAQSFSFDVNGKVTSGVYFVRVNNNGKVLTEKVLFN